MASLLALIPSPIKWGGIAVIGIGLAFAGGYLKGRSDGATIAQTESLKATIQTLKERGLINEDVQALSDCELLRELGGLCDDGR